MIPFFPTLIGRRRLDDDNFLSSFAQCCWYCFPPSFPPFSTLNTWNKHFIFNMSRARVFKHCTNVITFSHEIFQEKKPESAKKSKKDENGADDDEEVDDENEEAEDEEYELNYGEEIDGEGKKNTGKISSNFSVLMKTPIYFSRWRWCRWRGRRGRWRRRGGWRRWCVIDEIFIFVNVQWLKIS